MGEGLTADEARDAAFLLTGAGMWVGKLAYLAADPMSIQEGRRAIAQAVSDHQVKARGPGHPCVNMPGEQTLLVLISHEVPLCRMHLGMVVPTTYHHPIGPTGAKNIIGIGEIKGLNCLGSLHLPQTMGLRVTRVHY